MTTREAEAAALAAREAVETPLRLTSRGESWSVPETAVVSSLEVVRRDWRPEVAVDRDVLQNHLARAYAPSSWSHSRPDTRSAARSSR